MRGQAVRSLLCRFNANYNFAGRPAIRESPAGKSRGWSVSLRWGERVAGRGKKGSLASSTENVAAAVPHQAQLGCARLAGCASKAGMSAAIISRIDQDRNCRALALDL